MFWYFLLIIFHLVNKKKSRQKFVPPPPTVPCYKLLLFIILYYIIIIIGFFNAYSTYIFTGLLFKLKYLYLLNTECEYICHFRWNHIQNKTKMIFLRNSEKIVEQDCRLLA